MREIAALGYIGVEAADLAAWERFGTSLLGLQVADRRADGTLVFRLDDYAYRLAVAPGPSDDLAFIGWEVASPASLDRLTERLERSGLAVTVESDDVAHERRVLRLISFRDPDGIRHEAFVGPLLQSHDPFVSSRSIGAFVTGDHGLGHVVLVTDDLARQERFYCDVLGFGLSDYIDMLTPAGRRSFTFFHCSSREHSLALAHIPAQKKLAHIMLQTTEIDDVGLTYDLAQQQGHHIAATLGRHTNDRMFSFYVSSPSGWDVEFGADPVTLDDASWHVRRYDKTSIWGHVRTPRPALTAGTR
jgi:2,3-dihydroxybiphenyl 1,2-dioxygenase